MSWNFKYTSQDKEKLKAQIQTEQYVPPTLRDALCDLVETRDMRVQEGVTVMYGILVESDGHVDSNYAYGKFTCSRVTVI